MYKALILLFAVLASLASCQQHKTASLHITTEWQNKSARGYPDISLLKLYKDGKLYKTFATDSLPFLPKAMVIEDLPLGSYSLCYPNILNQLVFKKINLISSGVYYTSLYPDSSDYLAKSDSTCISLLGNLDSLTVFYDQTGCFDFDSDSFTVVREAHTYRLRYGSKEIMLTDKQRELLVKLEADLMSLPEGSCTMSESYRFFLNGKVRTYLDTSCRFRGWDTLIRTLNLQS